jgi:CspA family cold shock protein
MTTTVPVSTERFTGRVKWFNNKAGYGFITAADGPNSGSDIFVHHSSIRVDAEQYKYLVLGEYVEFGCSSVPNGNHEIQSSDVTGIKGGKLMCETRHEMLATRTNYKSQDKPPAAAAAAVQTQTQQPAQDKDWKPARKPRQHAAPSAPASGRGGRGQVSGRGGRGSVSGRGGRGRGSAV